jgi:hypothetical protein
MKPQFQHKLATSYLLWFENYFLKKSEAYSVYSGSFSYYLDDRLPDSFKSYGSEYKQMVYDSSLPNVVIPQGLYLNSIYTPFEQNKYILDFDNGRFIAEDLSQSISATGTFTVKDLNVYYTNDTEENIVLNVQESINQSVDNKHEFYKPYEQKLPAIYLSNEHMQNKPFAFGGLNKTVSRSKAIAITNNSYELDTVLSIFADSYNETFSLLEYNDHPLNEYGGLKNNSYSYDDLNKNKPLIYVDNVSTSKLSDKVKQNLLKDLYIGFIDFDLSIHRYRS